MINYYREKFLSYINDEDVSVNSYNFASVDMYTVIEIVIAAVFALIAKAFVRVAVLEYIMYIISYLILSREIVFRIISKLHVGKIVSRDLMVFIACFLGVFCEEPLLSVFSIWLYRLGDLVISIITADFLKKCGFPGVESIGYKEKKYRPKSSIEKNILLINNYLPYVSIGLSLLVVIISLIVGKFDWGYVLNFASISMIVSVNTVFPLMLPLIYRVFAFSNKRYGVKIGGFITFSALKELKSIVLNKSGILIKDEYVIYSVDSISFSEEDILEMAAYAEYNSNHPIAEAILRRYNSPINENLISNFEEKLGGGVRAELGESVIHVGSERFMSKNNIVISKKISNAINDRLSIYVAMNGEEVGCIQLAYKRLKNSKDLISLLKKNTNVSLLTAADSKLASGICEYFEINDYHAECSDAKSEQLVNVKHEEINENGSVAFVTNDAKRVNLAELCDVSVLVGADEFSNDEKCKFDVLIDDGDSNSLYRFFESVFKMKLTWRCMCVASFALSLVFIILAFTNVANVFWALLINILGSFAMTFFVYKLIGKRRVVQEGEKK